MQLYRTQQTVFDEISSQIEPFLHGLGLSQGYVVFDNEGGNLGHGGGEVDTICECLAETFDLELLYVNPYKRSIEVLESIKTQLLEPENKGFLDAFRSSLDGIISEGAIISTGYLITRYIEKTRKPVIVYIGPLELYRQTDYAIQDLIQFIIDHSEEIFLIVSVSKQFWDNLLKEQTTWQKVCERLRFRSLSSCIDPIQNLDDFVEYLDFLIQNDQASSYIMTSANDIWYDLEDKTYYGVKLHLGRYS